MGWTQDLIRQCLLLPVVNLEVEHLFLTIPIGNTVCEPGTLLRVTECGVQASALGGTPSVCGGPVWSLDWGWGNNLWEPLSKAC